MVKVWSVCVFWMRYSWILMRWDHFREDFLHPKKLQMAFMTVVTVKFTKPWTREIFMECYCVARNKPIRREITKTANSNGSLFCGFEVCSLTEVYCDWPVPNQHVSWNFEGVHGFLSLTVNVCVFPVSGCWKFFFWDSVSFSLFEHCLHLSLSYIKFSLFCPVTCISPREMAQGPEEICLSLEHQNPSKTSEKMGYFDRVTVSLHIL